MYIFRYIEVEARIVHEYKHVRLPLKDILLAHLHILQYGTQVQQHRYKTHIGQVAVVHHTRATDCRHQVTAEETELRMLIALFQSLHQMRGVQVSTGFTDNQVILQDD